MRKNREIDTDPIQLISPSYKKPTIVPLQTALLEAEELHSDLVEVNPSLDPPLCKIIIKEKKEVDVKEEELPHILRQVIKELNEEIQPFRKVHRLIDAIEAFIKLHTVIVVSDYFEKENVSDSLKGLLCKGLRTPSLGIWWAFARECNQDMIKSNYQPALLGIEKYLSNKGLLFKELEKGDNLISFRNGYAHGATPPDKQCQSDLDKYLPRFKNLLSKAYHLRNIELKVENEKVYILKKDGSPLSLHPLIILKKDLNLYFFYNDFREKEATILNYDRCLHERSSSLKDELLQKYPIYDWQEISSDKFKDKVELLTENFKGRKKELQKMTDFLSQNERGFLMIWGGPGVGKSALLARTVQMLGWSQMIREQAGIIGGISASDLCIIEYFIRRDMRTNNTDQFLDHMFASLQRNYRTGIKPGASIKEKQEAISQSLEHISGILKSHQRLVLIIDGLDEGAEVEELLESLPAYVPSKILVIYSSRENPEVKEKVYNRLDRENHNQLKISGLSIEDTRSLLHEHVNKYDLHQDYVEAVSVKSKGNPLYLKLLCEGLYQGDFKINNAINLPEKMEEMYEKIFERISQTPFSLEFLRTLAVAKDYLSGEMLASICGVDDELAEKKALNACQELCIENPIRKKTYQLFHESLREYIKGDDSNQEKLFRSKKKITDWCLKCKDKRGWAKEYILRYLIIHLEEQYRSEGIDKESILKDILVNLDDDNYRSEVFDVCGNASPIQSGFRLAQKILIETDENGSNMNKIFSYARDYHFERENRYSKQLQKLKDKAVEGDLAGITEITKMGTTAEEKFMLLLLGLYSAPEITEIPSSFSKIGEEYLKEINDFTFQRLWEKTYKK